MSEKSDVQKVINVENKITKFLLSKSGILIIILILLIAANVIYVTFYYTGTCDSFECFQNEMKDCSRVTYINDEPDASWKYNILGEEGKSCVVNVKLLQAKKGELGIDRIVGYDMDCTYPLSVGTYPEKDLSRCHGRLKEELQGIVIEKLHTNILENLGEIESSIAGLL